MDNGLIGKIEKAKRYSEERAKRVRFQSFTVAVEGENNPHVVRFDNNTWHCDCDFFHTRGRCVHTMTLEMILDGMVTKVEAAQPG